MKNSIEILNTIIETIGDEWKKYLDTYLKKDEIEGTPQYTELLSEFINAYKEDVIDNKIPVLTQIEKTIDNDLLFNSLKGYTDALLEAYHAIAPLRVLEIKDYKRAVRLVDFIFEQIILRFDPNAKKKYKEFEFEKEEEMLLVIGVLNSLCTFIVCHNLHKTAMADTIRLNTRLSRDISEYIAEIIDQNFEQLKTKIILEKLSGS